MHSTISVELDERVLQALADADGFPFPCSGVAERAALVLNRWAAGWVSPASSAPGNDATTSSSSPPHLYLSAPIADLVKGLISGHEKVGTALRHGNFGLGTLHLLDGEVVVLDGVAYQQTPEGTCNAIPDDALSPFMMVTAFRDALAQTLTLMGPLDLASLQASLSDRIVEKKRNVFWAIRIEGTFSYLKCRAVRKQVKERPLIEVTREQAIIEWTEPIGGTLVGFYSPHFIGHQLTVPGFHLHFIDSSHTAGGHVLALSVGEGAQVSCALQDLHEVVQELPKTEAFEQADFMSGAADAEKQLKEAEG